jgi:hypothetical protein
MRYIMRARNRTDGAVIGVFIGIALWLCVAGVIIGGWITHIIVAIQAQAWLFMIVGALIAPVAVIHGWAEWLGYNWLD